jgi:hypothetical protein
VTPSERGLTAAGMEEAGLKGEEAKAEGFKTGFI